MMRPSVLFLGLAGLQRVAGAQVRITNPDSSSSFHAGEAIPVQWYYEGTGENFSILLLKSGEQVADLCAAEENGVCFDLTQEQTVLLPEEGLESGSDYTVHLKDDSSGEDSVSGEFTIIGSSDVNIEITAPDGGTSLSAGEKVDVDWLYVGDNNKFDIYLRQDDRRVSENLCEDMAGGSCAGSSSGSASATVTIPVEVEDGGDYRLLVVDKIDDDAWGMSNALPIGISVAGSGDSGTSTGTKLGVAIGVSIGVICLVAVLAVCMRKRSKDRRREERAATLDMLNKRRPAPSVALNVEGMAEPNSPNPSEDAQRTFINPLYSTSQNFYEGQITPPSEDSAMWRRSRDLGRFVGRQISKSFSRSQSNMMND